MEPQTQQAMFEYLLRLGDDLLILGHRLSEWCGHAPILEEDVALANIALDCIGQAEGFLKLAGEVEGKGRSEDDLAYFRDEFEFRNLQLMEQPRGDFGFTIARLFLYDAFAIESFRNLADSKYEPLGALAAKALKETTYHLRHAREWMIRLGDGTEESHQRVQTSLNELWPHYAELFYMDEVDTHLIEKGMAPDLNEIRKTWNQTVDQTLETATLSRPPEPAYASTGSRTGRHSEHLGHLLAQMQILARSHPGAQW